MKIDDFEWDPAKAEENSRKHGICFKEGIECFYGPSYVVRSFRKGECRYRMLGCSDSGRYLTVVFALVEGNKARLISVRDMAEWERRLYQRKMGG